MQFLEHGIAGTEIMKSQRDFVFLVFQIVFLIFQDLK